MTHASKLQLHQSFRELKVLFNETAEVLANQRQSAVSSCLDEIATKLYQYRSAFSDDHWRELIAIGRKHPTFHQVLEDPFTRRAFCKPKGYPGDAILIDYIYGSGDYARGVSEASAIGRQIYTRNRMVPACQGVRNRRNLIAMEIGRTLKLADSARILSIAAGHLREAEQIHWKGVENLELFLVVDQDPDSLNEVAAQKHHHKFTLCQKTVRQILSGKLVEQDFDLIYVTGLYDYLPDPIAARLTEILFAKLRRDGKLLIANFLPTAEDAGYMELFMDWFLIYRSEKQMSDLVAALPADRLFSSRVFRGNADQICFAEMKHC